jgi:AcrR family transcriptional regulator
MQERSEITQRKLLDAAIDVLVRDGYGALSTTKISQAAGVSRGGQQHHFRTKSELVAEAVLHLGEQRMHVLLRRADKLPQGDARLPGALDLLWESFSGKLFAASAELWVAARTDAELRRTLARVERDLGATIIEMSRDLFGPDLADAPGFADKLQLALNLMRGIALLRIFQQDPRAAGRQWLYAREHLLETFAAD